MGEAPDDEDVVPLLDEPPDAEVPAPAVLRVLLEHADKDTTTTAIAAILPVMRMLLSYHGRVSWPASRAVFAKRLLAFMCHSDPCLAGAEVMVARACGRLR